MEKRSAKRPCHPLRIATSKSSVPDVDLSDLIEHDSLVKLITPSDRILLFLRVSRRTRQAFLGYLQSSCIPFEIRLVLTSNKSRFNAASINLSLFKASNLYIHVSRLFQCQPLLRAISQLPDGYFNSENRIILSQNMSEVHVNQNDYQIISNVLFLESSKSDISHRYCLDVLNQLICLNPSFRRLYCECGGLDQIIHFVHHMNYLPKVREQFIQNITIIHKTTRKSRVSTLPWLSVVFYLTNLMHMHIDSSLVVQSLEVICEILNDQAIQIPQFRDMISKMTIYCMHEFAEDPQVQFYSFKLIGIMVGNLALCGVADVSKSLRSDKAVAVLIDSLLFVQNDNVTLRHAFDAIWELVKDNRFKEKLVASDSLLRARRVISTPSCVSSIEKVRKLLLYSLGPLIS